MHNRHNIFVKINAVARAILRVDGKDPSCDLGPPVHSRDSWSGTQAVRAMEKDPSWAPNVFLGFLVKDQAVLII
jgi:hypothetical protein